MAKYPTTIANRPSTINKRPSTIVNRPSTIANRPSSATAPAIPTLSALSFATVFSGESVAWAASSTDSDLDSMSLVLDPGGSETVLGTDATSPYSGTWVVSSSRGAHTVVARATRGGVSTDSVAQNVTIAGLQLTTSFFFSSGTLTHPANVVSPALTRDACDEECTGAGGGGTTNVGAGGGGGNSKTADAAFTADKTVTVGTGAANANGGDTSIGTTCIAKGGLSGANGGTGGAAASGTGTTKHSGGLITPAAGTTTGGASAGAAGDATTTTPGQYNGALGGVSSAVGRIPGGAGGSNAAGQGAGGKGQAFANYFVPATSGFAQIIGYYEWRSAGSASSHVVDAEPGGTGGRMICAVGIDGAGTAVTASMTGWNLVGSQIDEGTGQISLAVFERAATGSDPMTVTLSGARGVHVRLWRGVSSTGSGTCGVPELAGTSGSSTNPTSVAITPSGGSGNYRILSIAAWDANGTVSVTAAPSGYTNIRGATPYITSTGCMTWSAEKEITGTTETPGAWTAATEQWCTVSVSIGPSG